MCTRTTFRRTQSQGRHDNDNNNITIILLNCICSRRELDPCDHNMYYIRYIGPNFYYLFFPRFFDDVLENSHVFSV